MRRYSGSTEEGGQHEPVGRAVHAQEPVGALEEIIDEYERHAGEGQPEDAPAGRTSSEYDEEVEQDGMDLVDLAAHPQQQQRDPGENENPEHRHPIPHSALTRHASASTRYPTPGSVRTTRGSVGSTSIFRRRFVMCTRRYCCAFPNS